MESNFKARSGKATVGVLQAVAPDVYFTDISMMKMEQYIDGCSDEIGWLGTAIKKEGAYYVEDVLLFDQDVHGTTTEITPEGLGGFGEELLKQDDGVEVWNKIKVWGHSHVNMSTSASGQDDEQMETFSDNGQDWFIRIIANKRGEMQVDVYDFESGIIYYNVEYYHLMSTYEMDLASEIKAMEKELADFREKKVAQYEKSIKKEIKKKVRQIKYINKKYKKDVAPTSKRSTASAYGYSSAYDYYDEDEDEKDVDKAIEGIGYLSEGTGYLSYDDIVGCLEEDDFVAIFNLETIDDVEEYLELMVGDIYISEDTISRVIEQANYYVSHIIKKESEKKC